jgi:hypothetical protein
VLLDGVRVVGADCSFFKKKTRGVGFSTVYVQYSVPVVVLRERRETDFNGIKKNYTSNALTTTP